MSIDFLSAELQIISAICLSGVVAEGKNVGSEGTIPVGDNAFVDYKFLSENKRINLNARIGKNSVYRADNSGKEKILHEHFKSNKSKFNDHQPISVESLEQLVTNSLSQANELSKSKSEW